MRFLESVDYTIDRPAARKEKISAEWWVARPLSPAFFGQERRKGQTIVFDRINEIHKFLVLATNGLRLPSIKNRDSTPVSVRAASAAIQLLVEKCMPETESEICRFASAKVAHSYLATFGAGHIGHPGLAQLTEYLFTCWREHVPLDWRSVNDLQLVHATPTLPMCPGIPIRFFWADEEDVSPAAGYAVTSVHGSSFVHLDAVDHVAEVLRQDVWRNVWAQNAKLRPLHVPVSEVLATSPGAPCEFSSKLMWRFFRLRTNTRAVWLTWRDLYESSILPELVDRHAPHLDDPKLSMQFNAAVRRECAHLAAKLLATEDPSGNYLSQWFTSSSFPDDTYWIQQ